MLHAATVSLTCTIVLHAMAMRGMGVQGYKLAKKVSVSVHAGASAHATGEDALLMVDKHKAQKSWWQKLSQSINLAGAWLFLRVLFVRLFLHAQMS